jgi:hypothetical protein
MYDLYLEEQKDRIREKLNDQITQAWWTALLVRNVLAGGELPDLSDILIKDEETPRESPAETIQAMRAVMFGMRAANGIK